jgi:hypothetical protein
MGERFSTIGNSVSMTVAVGQRYQDIAPGLFGRGGSVYHVSEIFRATDGLTYARVLMVTDKKIVKTLGTAVLEDRRRFRLLEEQTRTE